MRCCGKTVEAILQANHTAWMIASKETLDADIQLNPTKNNISQTLGNETTNTEPSPKTLST